MFKENGKGDYEGRDDRGQQRDPAEVDTEGPTGCRPRDESHDVIGRLDTACSEHDLLDREVHDPEGGRSQHDGSDVMSILGSFIGYLLTRLLRVRECVAGRFWFPIW